LSQKEQHGLIGTIAARSNPLWVSEVNKVAGLPLRKPGGSHGFSALVSLQIFPHLVLMDKCLGAPQNLTKKPCKSENSLRICLR